MAALAAVDLAALREVNPEVVGWIEIPDGGISYPLMQGANNQWYLKHTWVGDYSSVGSVFMDCRSHADLSDFHTILYGHRLRSGAMFAPCGSMKISIIGGSIPACTLWTMPECTSMIFSPPTP